MVVATQQIAGVPVDELGRLPLERLEAEILSLASHLGAGLYRLLVLIGEYDRRDVAARDGYRSTAACVSHRCGIEPRTARDHVRVARSLAVLPLISAAMASGELGYCKARAITRIARPETEAEMLEFARQATVVQLDVAVAAYRRCEAESLQKAHERHAARAMVPYADAFGMRGYDVRLTPEDEAVLAAALELAMKLLAGTAAEDGRSGSREPDAGRSESEVEEPPVDAEAPAESGSREPLSDEELPSRAPEPGDAVAFIDGAFVLLDPDEGHWDDGEWVWFDDEAKVAATTALVDAHGGPTRRHEEAGGVSQRRADALVHIAHAFLAHAAGGCAPGHDATAASANDRYLVLVQVDADTLLGNDDQTQSGACHLHDGTGLAAATVHRLACDQPLVAIVRDQNGNPLYMGRKVRNANRAQRRALAARSGGRCEWPGCDVRVGLQPHHSLEWVADHGPTDIDVLIHLCRAHHWAAHEGGCRIVPDRSGGFRFYGIAGNEIVASPRPTIAGSTIERLNHIAGSIPAPAPAGGSGEELDLELAVWALSNLR